MSERPDGQDDMDEVLRRMRDEFGPRRPPEEPPSGDPRLLPPPPPPRLPPQPPPAARPVRAPAARRSIGAPAAWTLLALNVLIYLITCLLSGLNLFEPDGRVLQALGWKQNDLIAAGEYWRLVTATFLHGNLVHIFFNGYALYSLGPEAERIYSTPRFLALYGLAGLAGSLTSYALTPGPSVGASGAIFGLIGGIGIFYYLNRGVLGQFGQQQLQSIGGVIFINLLIGFSVGGVIDNWAHLGGLAGGALAGLILAPRFSLNAMVYPPVAVRRTLPLSWAGAAAMLAALVAAAGLIQPPL